MDHRIINAKLMKLLKTRISSCSWNRQQFHRGHKKLLPYEEKVNNQLFIESKTFARGETM